MSGKTITSKGAGWHRFGRKTGPGESAHRGPKRTLNELSDEFGIGKRALVMALAADPGAPKPEIDNCNTTCVARVQWFDHREMRRWWAARKAAT